MVWVLWVQITFTAACLPGLLCPPPSTTTTQVRSYVTEEACREDITRTREEFETVSAYLDDLKSELGETPAPTRLLPEQRTHTLWCAPAHSARPAHGR